jgi:Glycosyltransferase family 87
VSARARDLVLPILAATAGVVLLVLLALTTAEWTDFENEAQPAFQALRGGNLHGFLGNSPAYAGSLALRAPFALMANLWDGGTLALFRLVAIPCVAAVAALGVVLWSRSRGRAGGRLTPWIVLAACLANPLLIDALQMGHAEDLLGAALCLGAVLSAGAGRPALAGVLLGLAVANKPWAVVAVGPVLVTLRAGHVRALASAAVAAAVVLAPFVLGGGLATTTAVAHSSGGIFKPWQIWWFTGEHGYALAQTLGPRPGWRIAPDWVARWSHPIVVLAPALLCLAAWRPLRRRRWEDGLLLLALCFLLRGLLDVWNTSYYALPLVLALVAWEAHVRNGPPLLAIGVTAMAWLTMARLPGSVSPDVQALAYLAWAVPLAIALGLRLVAPERFARVAAPAGAVVRRRLPTLAGA